MDFRDNIPCQEVRKCSELMEARCQVEETSWKVLPLAKPEAGGEDPRDHSDTENEKFKNKRGGIGK